MVCPACHGEILFGDKFCGECGREFSWETDAERQQILEKSERKNVTVLFSDLCGYTAMCERLDPEDVKEVMSGIFGDIAQVVNKYGGFIEKFIGDAVVALFGVPKTHEDDPVRAINAAREIHAAVEAMSPQLEERVGQPLSMNTGINTGLVVTGEVDLKTGRHGIMGDTINLASRLEDLAKPGEILVGENTYREARAIFTFERLEHNKIKGKVDPVRIYRVLTPKRETNHYLYGSGLGSGRKIYPDMVGRDKELKMLETEVIKTCNGQGCVVNITGEAGLGKSRLVAELRKREEMKSVVFLEGRAIYIGENLSFHPVIDLLKNWARIRDDESEASAFGKLEAAIKNLYPEMQEEIFPFIATLAGMKLSGSYAGRVRGIEGEALEKLILKSVRELLVRASEKNPIVIAMEDLHWADMSSVEMLESLFPLVEKHRILFINVFRRGYNEKVDRLSETMKNRPPAHFVEIPLQALDARMSETLIDNVLNIPSFQHPMKAQVVNRAGGNPFFLEEILRTFIDAGAVVVKNGEFEVTEKIETVLIPRKIHDVIAARLDRLDEDTRHLVKIASVIGRSFFYRVLVEVAKAIEDIDGRLSYLKDIQLIMDRERMDELEYVFKHALAQEAAYESILQQKRKELHLQVANSIEKVFGKRLQEFYGMLAYHYSKGEDLEKTEEYMVKAGGEALRLSASIEALKYYQEALNLYLTRYGEAADPRKIATFEKNIALALFNKGQVANAIDYFDRVLEKWGAGSPKSRILTHFRLISGLLNLIKNLYLPKRRPRQVPDKESSEFFNLYYKKCLSLVYLDSERCFVELITALKQLNRFNITEIEDGVRIWMSASGLFAWTGVSFKISRKILEYSKNIVNEEDIRDLLYYDLFALLYNFLEGKWTDIKGYDAKLVEQNLKWGEFWHVSTYVVFLGFAAIEGGHFQESERLISKLSEIWETYGNETAREYYHSLRIKSLLKSRKLNDAQRESNSGISFQSGTGRELAILYYLGYKAMVEFFLEMFDPAEVTLARAGEIVKKKGFLPPSYIGPYLIGQLLLNLYLFEQAQLRGDKADAAKYRDECYRFGKHALRNSSKNACDRTEVFRLMGTYFWLIGSQPRAIKYWNTSIQEGGRLGARVELARTHMEIGKRLLEQGSRFRELDGMKAEDYLEKASALFEEMDLEWDLEKLAEIAAQ